MIFDNFSLKLSLLPTIYNTSHPAINSIKHDNSVEALISKLASLSEIPPLFGYGIYIYYIFSVNNIFYILLISLFINISFPFAISFISCLLIIYYYILK